MKIQFTCLIISLIFSISLLQAQKTEYTSTLSVQILDKKIKPGQSTDAVITIPDAEPGATLKITGIQTEGVVIFEDVIITIPVDYDPEEGPFVVTRSIIALPKSDVPVGKWKYVIKAEYMPVDSVYGGNKIRPWEIEEDLTGGGEDSGPSRCQIEIDTLKGFLMKGGVVKVSTKGKDNVKNQYIPRDEFLILSADGFDYDELKWECKPKGKCPNSEDKNTIPIAGRVKFQWKIIEGEGSFVQLGCSSLEEKKDSGNRVIFMPAYLSLNNKTTTTIRLYVIDAIDNQAKDDTIKSEITIETIRKRSLDFYDTYQIKVKYDEFDSSRPTRRAKTVEDKGNDICFAGKSDWTDKQNLRQPIVKLPDVMDKEKMVVGQYIKLAAMNQFDKDKITLKCTSSDEDCENTFQSLELDDDVEWEWKIISAETNQGININIEETDIGEFIARKSGENKTEDKGRFVIYRAPDRLNLGDEGAFLKVKIQVKIRNPGDMQVKDDDPEPGEITLMIHRAGVALSYKNEEWLPTDNNAVQLISSLNYFDGAEWKNALDHMCRIHFFKLTEFSNEPGTCLNFPSKVSDINNCPDLTLKPGLKQETYNNPRIEGEKRELELRTTRYLGNRMKIVKLDAYGIRCRNVSDYFIEARSKLPQKNDTIEVHSEDFGSYGSIQSFAAIHNHTRQTRMLSIPHYEHLKVLNNITIVQDDNIINIPKDLNNNHIYDNGWASESNPTVQDAFRDISIDDETEGASNNRFPGDGLTVYEEYRGFKVGDEHRRLNPKRKDVFIHNGNHPFLLDEFQRIFDYDVHEIIADQYFDNSLRQVNFNYQTAHLVDQRGICLLKGRVKDDPYLLGRLYPITGNEPAPPNYVHYVIVDFNKVKSHSKEYKLNFDRKLKQVVAHELGHALNVYHHGDRTGGKELKGRTDTKGYNMKHSKRSGNIDCIMRYDNTGAQYQNWGITFPESIGTILCESKAGTGYNAGDRNFGNCYGELGNCKSQPIISGRYTNYPKPDH